MHYSSFASLSVLIKTLWDVWLIADKKSTRHDSTCHWTRDVWDANSRKKKYISVRRHWRSQDPQVTRYGWVLSARGIRAVLGGINTFLFGVIDLRRDVYQQYNGTTISLYGGVVLRRATLKIRKSTREREGKNFLFKEAQFPAGIKMWRQLWLKRTRPLDYSH